MVTALVNRVNGNDIYDYTQLRMSNASDKAEDGEQFSLAYQRAQEDTEDRDKSEKTEESLADKAGAQRTVMQGGVRLELSGTRQSTSDAMGDGPQSQAAEPGLLDTLRSWIAIFTQSIKDFIYKIWNDPVPQENEVLQDDANVSDAAGETVEPERLSEEYLALKNLEALQNPDNAARSQLELEAEREKEIQRLLRSGNMEQVVSMVTENGQKTMAKNSTLLTYYDRTGKIAPLSASDQERILHGDRSTRKL